MVGVGTVEVTVAAQLENKTIASCIVLIPSPFIPNPIIQFP